MCFISPVAHSALSTGWISFLRSLIKVGDPYLNMKQWVRGLYFQIMSVLTGATVTEVPDALVEFFHLVNFIVDEDPVLSYSLWVLIMWPFVSRFSLLSLNFSDTLFPLLMPSADLLTHTLCIVHLTLTPFHLPTLLPHSIQLSTLPPILSKFIWIISMSPLSMALSVSII